MLAVNRIKLLCQILVWLEFSREMVSLPSSSPSSVSCDEFGFPVMTWTENVMQ